MSTALVFNNYGGPDTQELIERSIPLPGPGEVVIEVKAAGVNPADWKIREGRLGRHWKLPAPLGHEASGVVIAVGDGVDDFAVGDEVLGLPAEVYGGIAEHTVLCAENTVLKPEEISFADAAAIPVAGSTAYDVTHQIELDAGQSLLILGAGGGVGLMAAQIGKVHQFTVLGVADASKKEMVESTGARFIESGDGVVERVLRIVPEGVDLVVDLVGGQPLRDIAAVAKDPKNVVSTADPATAEELGGAGVVRTTETLGKITEVVKYGLVSPYVRARFALADVQEAMATAETGHAAGKVIVEP
ncbi:NADP-dependent oxidoreductase [Paeniglutamicibacter antarcticus]|uniref:NADP-dependent oxidoreductase n=1 Tax=Paeniglutamicibacter antarcticus TaxID=494023 RepID=A0ABP9TU38_9MICC